MTALRGEVEKRWPGRARVENARIEPDLEILPALCGYLFTELGYGFGGVVVEEGSAVWEVRYLFYHPQGWVHVTVGRPLAERAFPSISSTVHAADWHEREAEDLFGLVFEGHPRLGDFILHDEDWQEGVEPMRHAFNAHLPVTERRPAADWRPRRIVHAPGAFVMPIGPIFSAAAESVHFLLETVGEEVIRAFPRLFYKYRGLEKIAEGRAAADALLLAERFSATTALAHAIGYCHAVEALGGASVPPRAQRLRVFLAELERLRHHVAAIESICESTALAVAASQAGILEEDLLRVCGALTGHRYLFGMAIPGGLSRDLEDGACRAALSAATGVLDRLRRLEQMLQYSSSFLDRLEEVGVISLRDARSYGLVGPVARASGVARDLRSVLPYGGYPGLELAVPTESEGDGYARLRVLFAEAAQAVRLMEQALESLPDGAVEGPVELRPGAALGWVEAPRGAALHWLRLNEDGSVARYRVIPPSFANWHGFHLSVENFAFQDFPIILATMSLSAAENDR